MRKAVAAHMRQEAPALEPILRTELGIRLEDYLLDLERAGQATWSVAFVNGEGNGTEAEPVEASGRGAWDSRLPGRLGAAGVEPRRAWAVTRRGMTEALRFAVARCSGRLCDDAGRHAWSRRVESSVRQCSGHVAEAGALAASLLRSYLLCRSA